MDSINWWGWIVLIGVPLLVSFAIGGGVAESLSKHGVRKAIALGIGTVIGLFIFIMVMIAIFFGGN